DALRVQCYRQGEAVFQHASDLDGQESWGPVSGPTATFRLSGGQDLLLAVALHQSAESTLAPDIAFRFLQRLSLATAERLERLLAVEVGAGSKAAAVVDEPTAPSEAARGPEFGPHLAGQVAAEDVPALAPGAAGRESPGWLRWALGWGPAAVAHPPWVGEK